MRVFLVMRSFAQKGLLAQKPSALNKKAGRVAGREVGHE
jgi:hypothetical protein